MNILIIIIMAIMISHLSEEIDKGRVPGVDEPGSEASSAIHLINHPTIRDFKIVFSCPLTTRIESYVVKLSDMKAI